MDAVKNVDQLQGKGISAEKRHPLFSYNIELDSCPAWSLSERALAILGTLRTAGGGDYRPRSKFISVDGKRTNIRMDWVRGPDPRAAGEPGIKEAAPDSAVVLEWVA
jgi:hypothetical protein